MTRLKRRVESAIGPAIRRLTGARARILMYHRPDPLRVTAAEHAATLEQQLAYLCDNFNVRPLSTVVGRLEAREALEPNTVVLTVDDGYRDFFDVTYPLLRQYAISATVYVVSDFASGRAWLWFDALRWLMLNAPAGSYTLSVAGNSREVRLAADGDRLQSWTMLTTLCMPLDAATRDAALAALQGQLGLALPVEPVAEYASMDWTQLRALDPRFVEIGAHTRTHTRLTSCSTELQRAEIAGSKSEIERQIGRTVDAFCYPNGMPGDFSEETAALVRACGFRSAVQAHGSLAGQGDDRFSLPRLSAPADFAQFRNCVNGLWSLRDFSPRRAAAP